MRPGQNGSWNTAESGANRSTIRTSPLPIAARTRLATILLAVTALLAMSSSEALAQQGYNALFAGHSFFRPFADGMPFHTSQAGIVGHTQTVVFSGGSSGACCGIGICLVPGLRRQPHGRH